MKKRFVLAGMVICILLIFVVLAVYINQNAVYRWTPPEQGKYERTIRVVSDADYAPISFYDKNGNPAGHDIELIYAMGELLGANIELDLMEWPEATKAFKDGEYDLLLRAIYAEERTGWQEFSTPILNESYVVFGKDAKDFLLAEMSGAKIALMAGDAVKDAIFTTYELDGNLRYFTTYTKCFEQLVAGKCDYVIAPESVGQIIIREMNIKGIEASNAILYNSVYCFAVQPGDHGLAEEVNGALRTLSQNGTVARVYEYWMQDYAEEQSLWEVLEAHKFLFGTILLLVLILFSLVVLFFEWQHSQHQKKSNALLRRERMLYRDALMHDCEYAFSLDLNEGIVYGLESSAAHYKPIHPFPARYDDLIDRVRDVVKPVFLRGTIEDQYSARLISAYEGGKRLLEIEQYLPARDVYQRKSIFLSKDEENGHVLGCVITKDITEVQLDELEDKRVVAELAAAAEQIVRGNLDVEINCKRQGNVGILAHVFQMTLSVMKQRLQRANDVAYVDTLTGLGNRTAYEELTKKFDAELSENRADPFGVVMVDLNDLKHINDTLGHDMGDLYIITAVQFMKDVFTKASLFRVGGDEFVAILNAVQISSMDLLIARLDRKLNEYNSGKSEFPDGITIAVGTAVYDPENDRTFKSVFERADTRMYQDKREKKNGENRPHS